MVKDTYEIARTSGDRQFLQFIVDRLVNKGDHPNTDFVMTLQEFADKINVLVNKAKAMDMVLAAMNQFYRGEHNDETF